MTNPFPTHNEVEETFRRVRELEELRGLIQSRLDALFVGASRVSVSPDAEYKALRDEMIHLFNRIFVLLAAMVGGSLVVAQRALDLRDAHPLRAWCLVGALCGTLAAAVLLTCKLYDHIYRIGSYIVVYHEQGNRWHSRVRVTHERLRTEQIPDKWFHRFGEPTAVALVYL